MGTNFYLRKKNQQDKIIQAVKERDYYTAKLLMSEEYIHIAKTSAGWLPVFEAHIEPLIRSVQDIKNLYDHGYKEDEFELVDEYDTTYSWDEFKDRVLMFEGGTRKNRKLGTFSQEDIKESKKYGFRDKNMPNHSPISHIEYANGKYEDSYFEDPEGYEFDKYQFC